MTTRRCSRFEFSYTCSPFDFFMRVISAVIGSYLLFHAFGLTIPTALLGSLILFVFLQPYAFVSFDKFDKAVHQAFNIFSIIFCISATFFLLTFSYRHYFSAPPANTSKNPCIIIQQPINTATIPTTESKRYSQSNCLPLEQMEQGVVMEPTDAIDKIGNDALLAILSLVIAFAGFMSYVFLNVVKANLRREITGAAHDERVASEIDMSLTASCFYTDIYAFGTKTGADQKQLLSWIDKSLEKDLEGLELLKKIQNKNKRDGQFLKIQNNYAYDTYLKLKRGYEGISPTERGKLENRMRAIRNMLVKYLETPFREDSYEDINENHREQFRDTCEKISKVLG